MRGASGCSSRVRFSTMMLREVFAVCSFLWLIGTSVPVTEAFQADVSISGNFSRPGLQGENCFLPDVINVFITSDDVNVSLEVSKSPRVTQDAPVYVIGQDGEVHLVVPYETESYALYQDLNSGSAVLVTCSLVGEQTPSVEGTVTYQGRQFHLRHSSRRRRDVSSVTSESDEYQLTEVAEDPVKGQTIDYVLPPEFHSLHNSPSTSSPGQESQDALQEDNPHHRLRRQAVAMQNVYIDITVVIAFDIYQRYYNGSDKLTEYEKEVEALTAIKKDYALLMSEVDLHYQMIGSRLPYNISIGLASFVVAQIPNASFWTEQHLQDSGTGQRRVVDTFGAWYALQGWVANSSSLPTMDYYLLFTGYDLSTQGAGTTNLGLAYIGGVCASSEEVTHAAGYNVAVIESSHFSQTVIVTTHELGHALGAPHDGEENECRAADQYTMTPSVPATTATNFGVFSACSLRYFNTSFARLSTSTQSESCIHEIISPAGIPNVTDLVPGQVYDVQAQCKRAFGNSSFVCPGLTVVGDTMCGRTFCADPSNPRMCNWIALYRGTTCGNKKWCVNAYCRSAPDASEMDESCPFGDTKVSPYTDDSRTCSQLATQEPWRCYDSYFHVRCCKACAGIRRNVPGCEYGNKLSICRPLLCREQSLWESCCDTCSAFLTTTPSNTTTPATTTTTSSTTTSTSTTTTATTTTATTTGPTSTAAISSSSTTSSAIPTATSTAATSTSSTTVATRASPSNNIISTSATSGTDSPSSGTTSTTSFTSTTTATVPSITGIASATPTTSSSASDDSTSTIPSASVSTATVSTAAPDNAATDVMPNGRPVIGSGASTKTRSSSTSGLILMLSFCIVKVSVHGVDFYH